MIEPRLSQPEPGTVQPYNRTTTPPYTGLCEKYMFIITERRDSHPSSYNEKSSDAIELN